MYDVLATYSVMLLNVHMFKDFVFGSINVDVAINERLPDQCNGHWADPWTEC